MDVLDGERMRRADRIAIQQMKIPGLVLMENAGRAVAEAMIDEVPGLPERRVFVVAGPGNNGGDGFVVARHLARLGVSAVVLLVGATRTKLAGDTGAMAAAWAGIGGETLEIPDTKRWQAAAGFISGDVIVDALFGTGLDRPLAGLAAEAVETINRAADAGAVVVAVDIPSGLFASSAEVPGPAVQADLTVTFARPKVAHLLPPAEHLCGTVTVADIGIPDAAIYATDPDLHWVLLDEAALMLPERGPEDHKGHFGHVLVVAGSTGKAGAAALTGWGALRAGAGLVTVAAPAPARGEVALFAAELMTEALPASREGVLARGAATRALALAKDCSVVAIGPGLGAGAASEVRALVKEAPVPVVLDADGINAFAGRLAALARRKAPLVVTPHPGEAARLLGASVAEVQADRVAAARAIARGANAVAVLKGYRTIVADPSGTAFINPSGNPGMATAGMGDALTGIIAGLMAQELEPLDAAVLGVFLHGLAADVAIDDGAETEATLTTGAVLEALPHAFERLADAAEEGDGESGESPSGHVH
jgi:NAD(P)H-hydrate epimerase